MCHEGEMKSSGNGISLGWSFWAHRCTNCNFNDHYDRSYPHEKIKYDAVAETWED